MNAETASQILGWNQASTVSPNSPGDFRVLLSWGPLISSTFFQIDNERPVRVMVGGGGIKQWLRVGKFLIPFFLSNSWYHHQIWSTSSMQSLSKNPICLFGKSWQTNPESHIKIHRSKKSKRTKPEACFFSSFKTEQKDMVIQTGWYKDKHNVGIWTYI